MSNDKYELLAQQLQALIEGEPDLIANLSNASAAINEALENINWAGFYLVKENMLVLGPFQGKPACIRIPFGKDRKSTRLNSSHSGKSRMPSSA